MDMTLQRQRDTLISFLKVSKDFSEVTFHPTTITFNYLNYMFEAKAVDKDMQFQIIWRSQDEANRNASMMRELLMVMSSKELTWMNDASLFKEYLDELISQAKSHRSTLVLDRFDTYMRDRYESVRFSLLPKGEMYLYRGLCVGLYDTPGSEEIRLCVLSRDVSTTLADVCISDKPYTDENIAGFLEDLVEDLEGVKKRPDQFFKKKTIQRRRFKTIADVLFLDNSIDVLCIEHSKLKLTLSYQDNFYDWELKEDGDVLIRHQRSGCKDTFNPSGNWNTSKFIMRALHTEYEDLFKNGDE